MMNNNKPGKGNRSANRYKAGAPLKQVSIKNDMPIHISGVQPDGGFYAIGTGVATVERAGGTRMIRVKLKDGDTINIQVF